jgi:predicted amidohydrolase
VAEADHDEPAVIVADIDIGEVAVARGRIPNLRNARDYSVRRAARHRGDAAA